MPEPSLDELRDAVELRRKYMYASQEFPATLTFITLLGTFERAVTALAEAEVEARRRGTAGTFTPATTGEAP